ncbi:MAG: sulfate permease [Alphaproteobacteria bacterium]|nr:sulfate permease [Alphaproteobacteria bacterium]
MNFFDFVPKSISSLSKGYSLAMFRGDFMAGLTVSIVALPLAMALAIASGTTPEKGLFTAIIAGFLISLLGGSRHQIGGPTGAFVVIIYNVIAQFGYEGLAIATVMAGIMLLIAGILKVGTIIRFIPQPVVTGFTSGIAIVLFTGQIKSLLGLSIENMPADFVDRWVVYWQHIQTIHWPTLMIGGVSLAILFVLQSLKVRLPSFLIVMTLGGGIVWLFGVPVDTIGSKFGQIPKTLPVPYFPHITWEKIVLLLPSAFTIAFLAGIESLLSAMIADGMTGRRHRPNAELLAQGVANIASVCFCGIPATGAIARTITNIRSGAQTPLAGIIHSALLLLFMWFLSPIVGWIPLTSLAAVMIIVAWNMSEIEHFRYLMSAPKSDRAVLLITFFLTIMVDLTIAVQVGITLAALLFMKRMNDVTAIQTGVSILKSTANEKTDSLPPKMPEGVEAFQITGPFFFCVANRLKDELAKIRGIPKVFILRMRHVPTMDATAAHTLLSFIKKSQQRGTHVIFAAVQEQPLKVMKQMKIHKLISPENFVSSTVDAIKRAQKILESEKT